MKQIKFLSALFLTVLLLSFSACSSDDDNGISTEDNLRLKGSWQLEKMDFLNKEDVEWDTEEVPFSTREAFGYAPYMFNAGEISGFSFGTRDVMDKEDEVLGSRFDYIMGGEFEAPQFDPNTSYWYWNYTDDQKSFMMKQVEGPLPPHDYTLHNIRSLKLSDDGETLVFTADLASRKVGAERGDNLETPVEFTIIKGSPSKYVDVFIDGEPYSIPEVSE